MQLSNVPVTAKYQVNSSKALVLVDWPVYVSYNSTSINPFQNKVENCQVIKAVMFSILFLIILLHAYVQCVCNM